MPIIQVIVDESTAKSINGTYSFNRAQGGIIIPPNGTSFPTDPAPVEGEWFFRTDENKAYRYNGSTWDAQEATASSHAIGGSSHAASTLAELNSKVSDATLDGTTSPRDPNAHSATHKAGGGDSIKLDELASPTDVTTLNATTSEHGLLPKLGGGTTDYLRADGTWAEPPGGGGGESNTASNVGTAGVGVFHQKSGVDLEFKKINAGSSKVTITDDTGNDEVDIDVVTGTDGNSVCIGNDSRLSDARTPTAHATSHEPGGGDAMTVDAVAGTGSLRTLGTGAQQACAGNDSRLSDSRTDNYAIHDNVAAEISSITEKSTPVSSDLLLIEDSADSNNKKRVQIGNLPGGSGGLSTKSGEFNLSAMSGSPLNYTVSFTTSFPDTNYSVNLQHLAGATYYLNTSHFNVRNRTVSGFQVMSQLGSSESAGLLDGAIMWTAVKHGES